MPKSLCFLLSLISLSLAGFGFDFREFGLRRLLGQELVRVVPWYDELWVFLL